MSRYPLTIAPVWAPWLVLLLVCMSAAGVALLYRLNRAKLGKGRALTLSLLRLAALALILAVALNPGRLVARIHTLQPAIAVLVDLSETTGQPVSGGQGSRLQQAASLLMGGANPLLQRLRERFRVELYGVSDSVRPLTDADLAQLVPGGPRADLDAALAELAGKETSVVLLSDGNLKWNGASASALPVVAVALGNPALYRDVLVSAVRAPALGFRGRPIAVDVRVKGYGYPDRTLPVVLKEDEKLLAAGDVHLNPSPAEAGLKLTFTPESVGGRNLSVSVPLQIGEAVAANNQIDLAIKVVRDKIRILMISGTPSMNYRFMRAALKSDPSIDLLSFVILRTPSDTLNVPANEQSLIPFPVETLFTKELSGFDLVVFDNFNYAQYLKPEYLENLRKFVREGGAFAMIGGPNIFSGGADSLSPVADLLPVRFDVERPYRRDAPVSVRMSRPGARHPIMQTGDDFQTDDSNRNRLWAEMPPIEGINLTAAKSSAQVLIESADAIPWPILAVSAFGRGRVLALATDESWKWYMGRVADARDGQPYQRLLHRMIRWLVKDPDLDPVRIVLPQTGVVSGREADVRILFTAADPSAATLPAADVSIFGPGGEALPSKVKSSAAAEKVVAFTPPKPGIYRVRVETAAGPQEATLTAARPQERLDAAPDHARLQRIAAATGGKFVLPAEPVLDAVAASTGRSAERFIEEKRAALWANPFVMALLLALLSLEWYLRRRWGLR